MKEEFTPWVGVDLDKTLAEELPGKFRPNKIGNPVPRMVKKVQEHLDKGDLVKIFTARLTRNPGMRRLIQHWLMEKAGLPPLEVTNIKDPGLIVLYDDRAKQVEPNTGKLLIEE